MKGFRVKQAKIRWEYALKRILRYVCLLLFQTDGISQTVHSSNSRELGPY